jgi:hypothetical protein
VAASPREEAGEEVNRRIKERLRPSLEGSVSETAFIYGKAVQNKQEKKEGVFHGSDER